MQLSRRTRGSLSYEEFPVHDSKSFAKFYAIYADLFPLPDEREPPDAFFEILALNEHTEIQLNFGPWREIIAAARLWQGGPLVGGHVFGVTTSPAHRAFGCLVSVQAIYTFLEVRVRGKNSISDMKSYMTSEALKKFGFTITDVTTPPLIFFEVNNPMRMTEKQIAQDRGMSGVDPFQRYVFWKRHGFSPLNFSYIQPQLRHNSDPVHYLDLFCSSCSTTAIPADLIIKHLSAFISISVLKGQPASDDPSFKLMSETLRPSSMVPFIDQSHPEQKEILRIARQSR